MIIDFRVRPPYKSFMHGILYEKQPEHPDPLSQIWSDIDKDPAVSAQEHSFKLFIEEMEASGISRAVIMGRKADEYGEVDNEDILEFFRGPGYDVFGPGSDPAGRQESSQDEDRRPACLLAACDQGAGPFHALPQRVPVPGSLCAHQGGPAGRRVRARGQSYPQVPNHLREFLPGA